MRDVCGAVISGALDLWVEEVALVGDCSFDAGKRASTEGSADVCSLAASSSKALKVRFNGEAVPGREFAVSLVGEAESARTSEFGPLPVGFNFGRGGMVSAKAVPGRDPDRSLPLCRLSGRLKGSSRRGGMSNSCVSGIGVVAAVEGRPVCGRGSAGSEEKPAGVGSAVADDQ